MPITRKHPDYVEPVSDDNVGSRWNWFQSEEVILPTGKAMCHRHPNGGGWVADTAHVSPSVLVDPTGFVADNAVVVGKNVEIKNYAAVFGNARVYGQAFVGDEGGSGFQKVYNQAEVFGQVTWEPGEGEVFPALRGDGRCFGTIIILGGAGIIEGPRQGDVYGSYKPREEEQEYLDTKYPNKHMAHSDYDPIRGLSGLDLPVVQHDLKWEPIKEQLWADIHRLNKRDDFSPDSF